MIFKKALLVCGLALPVLAVQPAGSAEGLPPASRWVPEDAALVLEASEPMTLLEPLLSPDLAKTFTALASNQESNLKLQQLQGIVAYLELQVGTDWRTGLRALLGGGLVFAIEPTGGTLLSVDAKDEKTLRRLEETVRGFASGQAAAQGRAGQVASRQYRDATAWTLVTNEAHAILGNRLLLANRPATLDRALDLRAEPGGKCIVSAPLYQAAKQAVGKDARAMLFLNMQMLRLAPNVKEALAGDANPLGALLLADAREALRHANWLALGIYLHEGKLVLKTFTDGQAAPGSKALAFANPSSADDGLLPALDVPGAIACLSLHRDLREFYAAKDELFPERTSGLVFFENMMGIFFSGIELTEGVLGETRPDIRLVVAAQRYDAAIGAPAAQMPAFAAVLRLRHPQAFGEIVEEAWQKAVGLANFTRGQQAQPGLIIDRASHSGVKYTLSYFRPPSDKGKAGIDSRYNYRPSLARPGDYVIISSTDGLAEDLIDAVRKEAAGPLKPSRAAHSRLDIDGAQLRAILVANRGQFVRKNMVEKGSSREQAETEIGFLLTAVDCLHRATLTLARDNAHPQATLELQLKTPGGKPEKTTAMK
jgi:hypothetical protein